MYRKNNQNGEWWFALIECVAWMYVIADKPNSSYIGLACKNQEWMNKGYKTQDFHLSIKKKPYLNA